LINPPATHIGIGGGYVGSRILVLINWAWDYLFYDRPIRLIVRAGDDPTALSTSDRPSEK